jgi:DNA repair exonuclease SbcCD ATPase subunit
MINFKIVRWKNFLSTGNVFTEVKLDKSKSTLIVGQNGAGKSTILDAISFALYNKPFRKINKPQLINSINNKDAVVEIEFTVGRDEY